MKKGVFIIPYFGAFKNYFQLFLNSCAQNPDYDWLLITDNREPYHYPPNVRRVPTTFPALAAAIKAKFPDLQVALNYPYKLCDLKPMYGYIFSDYIQEYRFWGHCDTDQIFGRLDDFISDHDLSSFDKLGVLGHFTLYRNNRTVNTAFKAGGQRYREVLAADYNLSFDEENHNSINTLFNRQGLRIKDQIGMATLYPKSSNFRLTYPDQNWHYQVEAKQPAVFVWDHGRLDRYVRKAGQVVRREYLYLHFQSREMKVRLHDEMQFKIIPNSFDDLDGPITSEHFPKIKHFNLHYFRLRTHNLFDKLRKWVTRSKR